MLQAIINLFHLVDNIHVCVFGNIFGDSKHIIHHSLHDFFCFLGVLVIFTFQEGLITLCVNFKLSIVGFLEFWWDGRFLLSFSCRVEVDLMTFLTFVTPVDWWEGLLEKLRVVGEFKLKIYLGS